MNRILSVVIPTTCLAALAAAFAGPEAGEEAKPAAAEQIRSLDWLVGSWSGPFEQGTWESAYTSADGGVILSASKEIVGGKVRMIEFEHFRVQEDAVVPTPYPFGRPSKASFKLTELDQAAKKATFSNPEHDFPRTIVYQLASADNLVIDLAGEEKDQPRKLRLDLKRRK